MLKLAHFINKLRDRRSTRTVYNPYQCGDPRHNLRLYLEYLLDSNRAVIAVGEAPGYLGCRHTGIPFTCGATLENKGHHLLAAISPRVRMKRIVREDSASHVWAVLRRYRRLPILWNAFPFHPHRVASRKSNRTPNSMELREGAEYLNEMISLFEPKLLVAIGRKAEETLGRNFPRLRRLHVPHPARGGHRAFAAEMTTVLRRFG
jgi:uracil-DNA glycosylase